MNLTSFIVSSANLCILIFQVTTTTKTIREVQYIGPDGQPIDFVPGENGPIPYDNHIGDYQNQHFGDYQHYPQHYTDYNRPPTPPTPSERSTSPLPNHRLPGKFSFPAVLYLTERVVYFTHSAPQIGILFGNLKICEWFGGS